MATCKRSHESIAAVKACAKAYHARRYSAGKLKSAKRTTPSNTDEFTSAKYAGSSTLQKAGKPEAAAGGTCNCGVFVAAGTEASHECR